MLICGVGSVPTDCGYDMGPGNWSPRAGVAYRLTENIVARRIRHQLRPVSAGVRPQHPRQLPLVHFAERAAAERAAAGRASGGRDPGDHRPDISSGIIPVPLNVSARALPDEPKRGYIHSWNATVQAELPGDSPDRPATSRPGSATSTRSWTPMRAR